MAQTKDAGLCESSAIGLAATACDSARPHGWQARYTLIVLLNFCNLVLFINRTNISVAVVYMYDDSDVQGLVLSSFYWGYLACQFVGGYVAQRVGGKPVLIVGVVLWTLATICVPLVYTWLPLVLACRVLVGCAEGVNYPSQAALCARWVPEGERSRAWAISAVGESVGTILAFLVCPLLVKGFGWQSIFYVSAMVSVAWLGFFILFASSDPETNPTVGHVSLGELAYIKRCRNLAGDRTQGGVPWRRLLLRGPFLATVTTHVCYNYSCYLALSWIPKYFKSKFDVDSSVLAMTAVLPYAALACCGGIAGVAADALQQRGFSRTCIRKLMNTAGLGLPAFFFWRLCALDSSTTGMVWATVYLTCAVGFGGLVYAGYWVNYIDLSPEHGMISLGIGNSIATLPGIVGQVLTGRILAERPNDWSLVYSIVALVNVFGALVFLIFATGRRIA